MKKNIAGKRYDTNTAKEVSRVSSEFSVSDHNWWEETLYRKRTGEFFIHGKGNAMSKYYQTYGDSYGPGEKLIPLTLEEAKEWVEKNDNELYGDIFEMENEANHQANFLIPLSLHEKVKDLADSKGCSQKEVYVDIISEYFK